MKVNKKSLKILPFNHLAALLCLVQFLALQLSFTLKVNTFQYFNVRIVSILLRRIIWYNLQSIEFYFYNFLYYRIFSFVTFSLILNLENSNNNVCVKNKIFIFHNFWQIKVLFEICTILFKLSNYILQNSNFIQFVILIIFIT